MTLCNNGCLFSTSEPVFQQKLRHTLKGIHHERHDVRRFALKTLHSHLKSNKVGHSVYIGLLCVSLCLQDDLLKLILSSDVTDPVITEIITAVCHPVLQDYLLCIV